MPSTSNKPLAPEQRLKGLEKQLHDERLKSALFEEVIEIMRDEHGITVKKFSDKLSVVVKSPD